MSTDLDQVIFVRCFDDPEPFTYGPFTTPRAAADYARLHLKDIRVQMITVQVTESRNISDITMTKSSLFGQTKHESQV